ncbi:hypothetical protein RYZ26_19400 [Terasakiella sp. A23]|uniref:hypothetical protein n=1 Tax=Terasakiella sp. FCG-A23 TaxID=3080561 RepID=UPI002955D2FC|nr:hypothetical protein [Terasakiella sp. A23]MDV7341776.1 hypothetical protein [Terasakiella sp. A23]
MTLYVDRIEKSNGQPVDLTNLQTVKGWCHSNNQTPVINDSMNVSSQTDHGTGDFTYYFINNMATTQYCVSSFGGNGVDSATLRIATYEQNSVIASAFHRVLWVATSAGSGGAVDQQIAAINWVGDLA